MGAIPYTSPTLPIVLQVVDCHIVGWVNAKLYIYHYLSDGKRRIAKRQVATQK